MNNSKTFCMHPFTGLATRTDGAVMACCRSHPIGWIQEESLESIWNNETIKRIRKEVLSNIRPKECAPCFNLEDQGVESLRQRHIKGIIPEARINLYPDALEKLDKEYSLPFNIPTIEIKLNNLCNLKCRMCNPLSSSSWDDYELVEKFYIKEKNFIVEEIDKYNIKRKPYLGNFDNSENWWASFNKILCNFRRVEFAGGEPLIDPQHYKILDMLLPYSNNIELKYATNATRLGITKDKAIDKYWPKFKSVAVNISIDGIQESFEYIRGNASWKILISNIKKIQKYENVSRIVGAVAVQVSNILILDKMIEYFLNNIGIVFYTNMVNYPNVLSIQVLPKECKDIAKERLLISKEKIKYYSLVKKHPILQKITEEQIDGIINYMYSKNNEKLWKDCIEYNNLLDKSRNQNFIDVTPEFASYV